MRCAQSFLAQPELLSSFSKADTQKSFCKMLNEQTNKLRDSLPKSEDGTHGGYWGTARKCLNIFLFECLLNRHLCEKYKLHKLELWLEVPLDKLVGNKLCENDPKLPTWDTIKRLEPNESKRFQNSASEIALKKNISRVYLNLEYWGQSKDSNA